MTYTCSYDYEIMQLPFTGGTLSVLFMSHKYRGSIVVLSISKSVELNEEQKEMTSGFQKGNVYKC